MRIGSWCVEEGGLGVAGAGCFIWKDVGVDAVGEEK